MTPRRLKAIRHMVESWRRIAYDAILIPTQTVRFEMATMCDVISELIGEAAAQAPDPGCQPAFEKWLDAHWPLWRDPKNQDSIRYFDLRAAFEAGWKGKA